MSGLPKKASDKVNTLGIVMVGVTAAVLTWASVVGLQAYYNNTAGSIADQRNAANKGREMRDLKAKQRTELQESKFIDAQKGRVTIPIESAMAHVLRSQREGEPSLVPAVGAHDLPTVPARWGKPADTQAPPTGGANPTPAAPGETQPAPASGTEPAPGTPAPSPSPTPP